MCEKTMLHGNPEERTPEKAESKDYPVLDAYLHDTGRKAITSANVRALEDGMIYMTMSMQASGREYLSTTAFLTKEEAAALRDNLSKALNMMDGDTHASAP